MYCIDIINGPNLGNLGEREPHIYGSRTWDECFLELKTIFSDAEITYFHSNHEGSIIDRIYWDKENVDAIIINAGAYSHTSIAIADAIRSVSIPVVEVHISNIMKRESFRHHSYISEVAYSTICGFGVDGYRLAIDGVINYLEQNSRF